MLGYKKLAKVDWQLFLQNCITYYCRKNRGWHQLKTEFWKFRIMWKQLILGKFWYSTFRKKMFQSTSQSLFIYFISFIYLLSNIKGNSGAAFVAKLKEQFDTLIDFSKRLK